MLGAGQNYDDSLIKNQLMFGNADLCNYLRLKEKSVNFYLFMKGYVNA